MKTNATFFEKVYIWVRQNFVNNVLMLNDYSSLTKSDEGDDNGVQLVKMQEMVYEGGVIIYTRIENVMIKDYEQETKALERKLSKRRARLRNRQLKTEEEKDSDEEDISIAGSKQEGKRRIPKKHKLTIEEELE